MFICLPCGQLNRIFSIKQSWGPCELCDGGGACYDIPSYKLPTELILATNVRKVVDREES